MNHLSSETFRENAKAALADVHLRGALKNATSLFGERRRAAAACLPNWEDLRNQARAVKDEVLSHLDQYLEEFVRMAESRGAQIHWARDAAEANAIICRLGISGVNFAIAETGTIVIVENEGNIRLTTSVPRMHIAVMGIEKVIPRLADLDVFLKLLPRSGTGQRLTTYQSFITGTKRQPGDEGPEELHVLLLDNGRSRMLAHPVTRQSLACIRCGACLNACPVYQQVGGHAYGSVYPGLRDSRRNINDVAERQRAEPGGHIHNRPIAHRRYRVDTDHRCTRSAGALRNHQPITLMHIISFATKETDWRSPRNLTNFPAKAQRKTRI